MLCSRLSEDPDDRLPYRQHSWIALNYRVHPLWQRLDNFQQPRNQAPPPSPRGSPSQTEPPPSPRGSPSQQEPPPSPMGSPTPRQSEQSQVRIECINQKFKQKIFLSSLELPNKWTYKDSIKTESHKLPETAID